MHPRVEAGGVTETGEVHPRRYQRVLRGVVSLRVVAEDRACGPERAVDPWRDKDREGITIAGCGAHDQRDILVVGRCGDTQLHV